MPKNRQYYRKTKYPDKVAKPKSLVFVRIFLFCSVGIKIQYFPTAPLCLMKIHIKAYLFILALYLDFTFVYGDYFLCNRKSQTVAGA